MHVHNYYNWVRYAFWTFSCESVTSKFKNGAPLRIIPFYMPALFLQPKFNFSIIANYSTRKQPKEDDGDGGGEKKTAAAAAAALVWFRLTGHSKNYYMLLSNNLTTTHKNTVHTHTQLHTHTYIHTYTHTHTHTHTTSTCTQEKLEASNGRGKFPNRRLLLTKIVLN